VRTASHLRQDFVVKRRTQTLLAYLTIHVFAVYTSCTFVNISESSFWGQIMYDKKVSSLLTYFNQAYVYMCTAIPIYMFTHTIHSWLNCVLVYLHCVRRYVNFGRLASLYGFTLFCCLALRSICVLGPNAGLNLLVPHSSTFARV
jgi:hypothetical protein